MKHKVLILFVILPLFLIKCNKDGTSRCFKGNGSRTTELRKVAAFNSLYVEDNIDVVLKQGPVQEVIVEAGENLIPLIRTEVINNELHIKNDNKCNWARSYKKGNITVHITSPSYNHINDYGSGLISSRDTLTCDSINIYTRESGDIDITINTYAFFIQNIGSSDITVKGKTSLFGVFHTGEGFLYCQDLKADVIWTYSEASGNEYYFPQLELSATINWVGDVYYKGAAPVRSKGKGTGKLIQSN
ncbi:MAG TPA: head GIN domain-containing protein [Bacteroidia bacterium]|nr:head GIN domain-containing protein [Bacteroidia bacterium]